MIIIYCYREFKKFYQISLQKKCIVIFCFHGVLIQPTDLFAERTWQLFQEDHEVTVYTLKTEENYTLKTEENVSCEFKAVGIIHQPIEVVGAALMDIPTYMKWIHGCRNVKLLKKNNDSNYEVYFAIDIPWPFYNRDIIYRITNDATAGEKRMTIQGIAIEKADVPIRDGYDRVIEAHFHLTLEKITDSSTKVIYQSKTDASFNAPAYLSRMICGSMVYNSMVNLITLLNNEH